MTSPRPLSLAERENKEWDYKNMENRVEDFLKQLKLSNAATTYIRKRAQLKAFLSYLIVKSKKHYCDVKKEDVEAYLLQLSVCQQSKQQICHVIKEFYDYIFVLPNPAGEIKFLRSSWRNHCCHIPSVGVVRKIVAHAGEKDSVLGKRNALMLELAYGSGIRRTELIRLNVEDIDFVEKTVHIWGKGDKERIAPITASAVNAVREYLFYTAKVRGPLFLSQVTKGRLRSESINGIFKKKVGIRPHLFRHACAAHMLKAGCNIRYIQDLLGHEQLCSTQVYTQVNKEDLRRVVEKAHPRNALKPEPEKAILPV
jgi:site-specific recombinase XerD